MAEDFEGIIIEESLADTTVLDDMGIISTEIEPVTEAHKTPWVKQWTMHRVRIPAEKAVEVAEKVSKSLDTNHHWYADFKTATEHYIVYTDKVFHVTDRTDKGRYDEATRYGVSIGIPDYQVDFAPHVTQWDR